MTAAEIQLRALGIALGDIHWKTPDGEHVGVWEAWGANDGPRVRQMLNAAGVSVAAPWCMAAVFLWTLEACRQLGIPHPLATVRHKAFVQSVVDWALAAGKVVPRDAVLPGDLVCFFDFSGNGKRGRPTRYDHVGILRHHAPGSELLEVVEGNTFFPDGDDDAPGQRGEREGYEVEVRTDRRLEYNGKPTLFIRWADAPAVPA